MSLDVSQFESKFYVIVFIVAAAFSSVLLHGCVARVGSAGLDTRASYEQLPDEPTQTPSHRVDSGEVPDGLSAADWTSIQAQIATSKYRAYPPSTTVETPACKEVLIRFVMNGVTDSGSP